MFLNTPPIQTEPFPPNPRNRQSQLMGVFFQCKVHVQLLGSSRVSVNSATMISIAVFHENEIHPDPAASGSKSKISCQGEGDTHSDPQCTRGKVDGVYGARKSGVCNC